MWPLARPATVLPIPAKPKLEILIYPCKRASVVIECGPQRLEDMSQRFSPNHGSVAHALSAFLQRIGRRNLRVRARDWNDPETLSRLEQIQETKSEAIDPDTVMDRIVKLAWKELRADGIGVWLFTDNETFLGAGAGQASNDERLRLKLFSTLLTSWRLSKGSLTQMGKPVASGVGIKSWLVEPLYRGHNVAGVLAAFSSRLDAFAELDSAKLHSFADVLAKLLAKATSTGSAEYAALEPALVLQLIEHMIPGLQHMVGGREPGSGSISGSQKTNSDDDPLPSVLSAKSAEETKALDRAVRSSEQVDTTWLETDTGPPRPPEVSPFRADHHSNASTVHQTTSESEVVECSNLETEDRPNRGRAATVIRNYTMCTLRGVRAAGSRLVNHGGPESRPGLPKLFRRVTVIAVLVTTIGLLVLKTDLHIRIQVAKSSSGTRAPEKKEQVGDENPIYRETSGADDVVSVATRPYEATEQSQPSAPMQVSHMQVTDNNARNVLQALSQYELVGLRRRALYGDESAAFLMGMAYEIGYGVRQDCKTAAQWVSNAAAEGNALAQYNLGLRFRDGDGVPMNTQAAMKWLQKAAGHQIPGAQMALTAVTSRRAQVAASRR